MIPSHLCNRRKGKEKSSSTSLIDAIKIECWIPYALLLIYYCRYALFLYYPFSFSVILADHLAIQAHMQVSNPLMTLRPYLLILFTAMLVPTCLLI